MCAPERATTQGSPLRNSKYLYGFTSALRFYNHRTASLAK